MSLVWFYSYDLYRRPIMGLSLSQETVYNFDDTWNSFLAELKPWAIHYLFNREGGELVAYEQVFTGALTLDELRAELTEFYTNTIRS